MKTLYVSDMDGTLLQPDARLSERTVSMLNEAIASGKLFTVATARTPATVAPLMQRVNMNIPAIVMTGAALWNPADGRYSRLRLMGPGGRVPRLTRTAVRTALRSSIRCATT